MARPHLETLLRASSICDSISECGDEIGERIERFDICENLRKFERRVIAQLGSGLVALFANLAYFGS
jgi:hypothetical protein